MTKFDALQQLLCVGQHGNRESAQHQSSYKAEVAATDLPCKEPHASHDATVLASEQEVFPLVMKLCLC